MRNYLSNYFVERAQQSDDFVILSGDHGYALFDAIRKTNPDKFINAGIAEQNMIGLAAGMAAEGFRPIVYGLASFVPIRVLEQIKLDLCYPVLPVIMLGDGGGLVYSKLGASHQCMEDVAALRSLPHISIASPADKFELAACMKRAEKNEGPTYIRIGKADLALIHSRELTPAELDAGLLPVPHSKSGKDFAIVATGSMVAMGLEVAKGMEGLKFDLFSVPMLKPLAKEKILATLRGYKRIFTYEEHCEDGGLGSIIAEALCDTASPIRVTRIGSPNKFSGVIGSHAYLLKEHGLDAAAVISRIRGQL